MNESHDHLIGPSNPTKVTTIKVEDHLSGCIGGPLMVFGAIATLTVYGAIFGVPMIIVGVIIVRPRKQPVRQGSCPYCGTFNRVTTQTAGFNCAGCAQRILIRDERFHRIDLERFHKLG